MDENLAKNDHKFKEAMVTEIRKHTKLVKGFIDAFNAEFKQIKYIIKQSLAPIVLKSANKKDE